MRISTIMAVYNAERYVSQALDSVLGQTAPPDEIIAIDDGSSDGTPDVLRQFAPRVRIIHGFGTGALKNFVHHFLKDHPHVSKYGFAPSDQGGNGATIAELK